MIDFKLTQKQRKVYKQILKERPSITLMSGSVRSGKTFIMAQLFLHLASQYKGKVFIGLGVSIGAFKRNFLDLITSLYGITFTIKKDGSVDIFGNKLIIFGGAKANSYEAMRSLTAQLVIVNEATLIHETSWHEIIARASELDAMILADTNPDSPAHHLKTSIVDNDGEILKSGRIAKRSFIFALDDNTTLSEDYKEILKSAIPKGFAYDKLIKGLWVSSHGVVYTEFNPIKNIENNAKAERYNNIKIIGGIDYGFTNPCAIILAYINQNKETVIFYEESASQKTKQYWVERALWLQKKYRVDMFYGDTEDAEANTLMKNAGVNISPAVKKVYDGNNYVNEGFMNGELLISDKCPKLIDEVYNYKFNPKKEKEVIKKNDHHVDAMRYLYYSDNQIVKIGSTRIKDNNYKRINNNHYGGF